MAGLSFLYAFFNLYGTGETPTLEEAMMDIESCMGVLEYLSCESDRPRNPLMTSSSPFCRRMS